MKKTPTKLVRAQLALQLMSATLHGLTDKERAAVIRRLANLLLEAARGVPEVADE
jgi:hypothetical protein